MKVRAKEVIRWDCEAHEQKRQPQWQKEEAERLLILKVAVEDGHVVEESAGLLAVRVVDDEVASFLARVEVVHELAVFVVVGVGGERHFCSAYQTYFHLKVFFAFQIEEKGLIF